ncbi:hypothetical protein AN1V17_03230 [Vallitalea sediminicola]
MSIHFYGYTDNRLLLFLYGDSPLITSKITSIDALMNIDDRYYSINISNNILLDYDTSYDDLTTSKTINLT